jgi:hypothetical protein
MLARYVSAISTVEIRLITPTTTTYAESQIEFLVAANRAVEINGAKPLSTAASW